MYKPTCIKIKQLPKAIYVNIINTFNNQQTVEDIEYVDCNITKDFRFNNSSIKKRRNITNKFVANAHFHIYKHKNGYKILHITPTSFKKVINKNIQHDHVFFSVHYGKHDLDSGHVGTVCYLPKSNELILLDPNGSPPFDKFVHGFMKIFTFDLSRILGQTVNYLDVEQMNLNFWPETSIFGSGVCCAMNLFLIYKISEKHVNPKETYKIKENCNHSILNLQNEIIKFLDHVTNLYLLEN